MIDVDVKRVLEAELKAMTPQVVLVSVLHPDQEMMYVECENPALAKIAADRLESEGFKVILAELRAATFFNVHLGMESLKKRGVFQITAAIEFLSDDVDEVRELLIQQLNTMGARTLVADVKFLYDREKKAGQS